MPAAPRFLVATSILLAREASCSFSAHKQWPEPQRGTRQAAAISQPLTPVDPTQGKFIRQLFEWEHARAGLYERAGEMAEVKAGAYWADPRIHNFGNLGSSPTAAFRAPPCSTLP